MGDCSRCGGEGCANYVSYSGIPFVIVLLSINRSCSTNGSHLIEPVVFIGRLCVDISSPKTSFCVDTVSPKGRLCFCDCFAICVGDWSVGRRLILLMLF